jgi:hypothetical protein
MSESSPVAHSRDTLPMSVANMTFLVNRLGEDCAPLQFVRELTQNALESCSTLATGPRQVCWDVDWKFWQLSGVYKLCCIDTGLGMTGPEMVQYINQLSSSIHQQGVDSNFGVGAKIAAAPRNPHGLVYMSWKGGVGSMIHLWFDPEERVYGLKRWPQNNGEFWCKVNDDLKPDPIGDHGTVVTLLGDSDTHNSMQAPPQTPMPSRWVLRYLNSRYFRFPDGVVVSAREGWEKEYGSKHNFLREVHGQGRWLDDNCESSGVVDLTGAKAYWWIIKTGVDTNSGHTAPVPHVAALYQNELYEMALARAAIFRLQAFGVIFGYDRVVIYIQPDSGPGHALSSNTARTQLLLDAEPLPWAGWAAEFREKMPDALVQLQQDIGAKSGEQDYKKAIQERLKQIRDLLRFRRYRPSPKGSVTVDVEAGAQGGNPASAGTLREGRNPRGGKGGLAGDIYALFAESGGQPADPVDSLNEPEVQWVSEKNGTRTSPFLDNRAATFSPQQNLLQINADFRVFVDMVDRWAAVYSEVPGVEKTVESVVHEWFTQQLVEAVMSAMALKSTGSWSMQELEDLWTESALTAAVLPRWHIDQNIKRSLGSRLGKANQVAA